MYNKTQSTYCSLSWTINVWYNKVKLPYVTLGVPIKCFFVHIASSCPTINHMIKRVWYNLTKTRAGHTTNVEFPKPNATLFYRSTKSTDGLLERIKRSSDTTDYSNVIALGFYSEILSLFWLLFGLWSFQIWNFFWIFIYLSGIICWFLYEYVVCLDCKGL